MQIVSQSWLCQRLSWEFGSFLAKFGVSFIDVVILNCSLCFAHVKGSFQSPGNGSKVTQGHERSRLSLGHSVARAARVVPAVLMSLACGICSFFPKT